METKEKKQWDGMKLSPTSILTFRRCPREFYYHYIKRLQTPPSIHLLKGNVVHNVLENFFKGTFNDNLEQYMSDLLEAEWLKQQPYTVTLNLTAEQEQVQKQDCVNMLNMYLTIFRMKMDGLRCAGKAQTDKHAWYLLKPKFREKYYFNEDLNLCGYVDRIHKDFDGEVTIADYKTSNRYGVGIKAEYEVQCGIYALLYKLENGVTPDYTSIIFIRFGEEVRTRVTPTQIKNTIEIVKDVHSKIKTDNIEDYNKKESNFCKICGYFNKCSGIEEHETDIRIKKVMEQLKPEEK